MAKSVVKIAAKDLNRNESAFDSAKKILGDECICCVMISCNQASANGKMEVEMQYEGDEALAAYLLESASQVFEERLSKKESK